MTALGTYLLERWVLHLCFLARVFKAFAGATWVIDQCSLTLSRASEPQDSCFKKYEKNLFLTI